MITNPIRCDYLRAGTPTNPALNLAATKNYLKIDPGQTTDDDLITQLIATAAIIFESFTGVTLLSQAYEARCTGFPAFIERQVSIGVFEFNCIQIKKTPLQGDPSDGVCVNWLVSEFEVILDTRSTYPAIFALKEWPITDRHPRPVTIDFFVGFGDTFLDVPPPIRTGLMQHIALMYENRGDCACDKAGGSGFTMKSLPPVSRAAYAPYIIYSISNSWPC